MDQDCLFRKYGGALLYTVPPHCKVTIDEVKLKKQVIRTKSFFGRYFTDSELLPPPDSVIDTHHSWWHCVCDSPMYLEELSAKQRYRVNKGLKLNTIYIPSCTELKVSLEEITDMLIDSYSDYPSMYKPDNKGVRDYALGLIESCADNRNEIWLVKDKESSKLVGMAFCRFQENMVHLSVVKVRPSFLKNEVNAALVFEICHYYINGLGKKYVSDGERNIRHITNYQDFLCRVLNFHFAYCQLHVVYHPIVKPLVNLLFPIRKIIERFGKSNKLIYNVTCLLKQEEIAREYR